MEKRYTVLVGKIQKFIKNLVNAYYLRGMRKKKFFK